MAAAQAFKHGGQLSGAVGECCTTSPYAAMMSAARDHEQNLYSVSCRERNRAGGSVANGRCLQLERLGKLEWRRYSSSRRPVRVEAKAYDAAAGDAAAAGWRWFGEADDSEEGQLLGMQAEAARRGAVNKYKEEEEEEEEAELAVSIGEEGARRLKLGLYFAAWWGLNVVFNVYNKKVLNVFPYPWLTSALSLAAGSLIMLASWATRIVDFPATDLRFWKALAPVAVAHTIGHVAATVSMSKVAVSFTHIIKSSEPAFSVLVSRFLLGDHFSSSVYLSLIPIIGGCGLAALTELNFNLTGFMGAMISNLAFVFRNIFSKKGMSSASTSGIKASAVGGMNYYACLSMFSLALLTPFAFAVEGPKLWAAGWQSASQAIGPHFAWWVVAQSAFYHLYNQVSYMSLDEISPLSFSIGNTMKRVSVIVASIIIFHTPVRPINALGAAIAILGTFLYAQAK